MYGVGLLSLSVRKLLGRSRAGLDDPRPELPADLDEPPRRPLPPFLFSLMMSSSDMLILSANVAIFPREQDTLEKHKIVWCRALLASGAVTAETCGTRRDVLVTHVHKSRLH